MICINNHHDNLGSVSSNPIPRRLNHFGPATGLLYMEAADELHLPRFFCALGSPSKSPSFYHLRLVSWQLLRLERLNLLRIDVLEFSSKVANALTLIIVIIVFVPTFSCFFMHLTFFFEVLICFVGRIHKIMIFKQGCPFFNSLRLRLCIARLKRFEWLFFLFYYCCRSFFLIVLNRKLFYRYVFLLFTNLFYFFYSVFISPLVQFRLFLYFPTIFLFILR